MLGIRTYTREYLDQCRARVDRDLRAYNDLRAAMHGGGSGETPRASGLAAFESRFFNGMVLALDYSFVHRLRTVEGKDGNPLNEVRVICDSILSNQSKMRVDATIKLSSAKSLLKYQVGDEITLSEASFRLLSVAFFAEIEAKYL